MEQKMISRQLRDLKQAFRDAETNPGSADRWPQHLKNIGKELVAFGEQIEKRLDALEKKRKG